MLFQTRHAIQVSSKPTLRRSAVNYCHRWIGGRAMPSMSIAASKTATTTATALCGPLRNQCALAAPLQARSVSVLAKTKTMGLASSHGGKCTGLLGSSRLPQFQQQQHRHPSVQTKTQRRSYTIPVVLESGATGERSFDIYSRLLRERIVCVHGEVTDQMASVVTAQLLFLEAEDPDSPLYMYINSPGGSVTAGMAMYDTMRYIRPKVHTIAMGQAASMGSLLLAGGSTGFRSALPNATIMLHQPSGGAQGMASDIQIRARELLRVRSRLNDLYVYHATEGRKHGIQQKSLLASSGSGGDENGDADKDEEVVTDPLEVLKEIEAVMDRDTFMTADQALRFGIIDEILIKREEEEDDNDA